MAEKDREPCCEADESIAYQEVLAVNLKVAAILAGQPEVVHSQCMKFDYVVSHYLPLLLPKSEI